MTRSPRTRTALAVVVATCLLPLSPGVAGADSTTDSTVPAETSTTTTAAPTTTVSEPAATTTVVAAPVEPVRPSRMRIGSVLVVLSEQRAYVYSRTGRLVTNVPVSTGLWDSTPTGSFRVFSKSALTFYTPNPGERMRWMVRFTKGRRGDNIGFHGIPFRVTATGEVPLPTPVGVAPSSHGCVRSRNADAKWLFDNMPLGTRVRVVRTRSA